MDQGSAAHNRHSLKMKMAAIASVFVFAAVCYAITAAAWFCGSLNASAIIKSGSYAALVEIVKDPEKPADDSNLIWSSGSDGITSYDGVISLAEPADKAYIRVTSYNYGESTLSFKYKLVLSEGAESKLEPAVLNKGESDIYTVSLSGGAFRLQLFTCYASNEIYTVSEPEKFTESYKPGSVLYLTKDIKAQKIVFKDSYPNINLNGHKLEADSIEIKTDAGTYKTMCIENGTLVIGGKVCTDKKSIEFTGDGYINLTLFDLYG